MAEQGFFGLFIPEEYGGSGADLTSTCLVLEELAKASPAYAGPHPADRRLDDRLRADSVVHEHLRPIGELDAPDILKRRRVEQGVITDFRRIQARDLAENFPFAASDGSALAR